MLTSYAHEFRQVGTQSDLRSNVNILIQLMEDGLTPISDSRAMRLSKKIGAKYIECSSFNGFNVKVRLN
jgi:hypothetical protein